MKPILLRLSIVIAAFILVILLYGVTPIRFFSFDFFQVLNASLFKEFGSPGSVNSRIILLNAGTKTPEEINAYIKLIRRTHPSSIGVNLCHLSTEFETIKNQHKNDKLVVFADCALPNYGLGRIVNIDNSVTHFQSDIHDSFERKLLKYSPPSKTKTERINYSAWPAFYAAELDSQKFNYDIFTGSIVLIGYLGDYLVGSDESPMFEKSELRYFKNARITPMNESYMESEAIPDMYDTEISARIVACLLDQNFIRDVSKSTSVAILLAFILFQTLVMSLFQNKNIFISIVVGLVCYFLIKMAGSFLIVYLFTEGYYLQLDELMLLLVIVIIFNLGFNVFKKTNKAPTLSS